MPLLTPETVGAGIIYNSIHTMTSDKTEDIKSQYVYCLELKVRDYEVDSQGIVNNAIYLHYLEHTRHMCCEDNGLSFRDMSEDGLVPVVRKIEIEYLHSLGLADQFVSCLNLHRHGARFIFSQDIYRLPDMLPIVKADVTIVCMANGKLTRGDQLADAFKGIIS